jgi:hypothetical protein
MRDASLVSSPLAPHEFVVRSHFHTNYVTTSGAVAPRVFVSDSGSHE